MANNWWDRDEDEEEEEGGLSLLKKLRRNVHSATGVSDYIESKTEPIRQKQEQQRKNAQFQAEQNAELANWIKGMSPTALEEEAQQRRVDAARGIYTSDTGEKKTGSGRSLKKRAEDYYTPSPQTQPNYRLTPDLEAARQRAASSGPYTAPNAYQTAMMQRDLEARAKKDASGWKSAGYTAAGMGANFISGVGNPIANIARMGEMPYDLLYAITKNEKYNLDREPGLRDSEALKASDDFAATAQEMRGKVGTLGQKLIDTAGAAGNMMGSFALFGGAAGAAGNPVDATARLANLGGGKIGSALGQAGAKIGMELLSNPGNFGISLGSAVGSYSDALKDGAGFGKALVNGLLKGGTEYYSNKLFSGTPFEDSADKGYVTKLIEYAADKIGGSKILQAINATTGGRAANWIFDKAGEGLEEVVTRVMDPMIDRITYKKDVDYATVDDLADEFFGGVLLSLLMEGGEALLSGLENQDRITEREVEQKLKAFGIDAPTARQFSPELAKALTALMTDSANRRADFAEKSAGDAETAEKGANSDSETLKRYADVYNRAESVRQLRQGANPQRVNQAAFLTENEANNYFYIWNQQGAKAADAFYQIYLAPELEQRRLQAMMEYIRQDAIRDAQRQAKAESNAPPVPQNRAVNAETQQETERSSQLPVQNQQEAAQDRTEPPVPQEAAEERDTPPVPQQEAPTPPVPQQTERETQERVTTPPTPQSVQTAQESAQEGRTPSAETRNDEGKKQTKAQQTVATQRKRAMADSTAVSLQSRGFTEAGAQETAFIREKAQMDAEERAVTEALRAEGLEPTLFTGLVTDADGKKVSVLQDGNRVALQADNRSRSLTSLAEQVLGHPITSQAASDLSTAARSPSPEGEARTENTATMASDGEARTENAAEMDSAGEARSEAAGNQSTAPAATGAQTTPTQTAPAAPGSQTTAAEKKPAAKLVTRSQRAQRSLDSAKQYGVNQKDAETAARLADLLGRDILWYNDPARGGTWEDGKTIGGAIYINAAVNKEPVVWVVGHELTHNTENAKVYKGLKNLAKQAFKAAGGDWQAEVDRRVAAAKHIAEIRGNDNYLLKPEMAEQEMTADYFATKVLTDEDTIRQIVRNDPTTARGILSYLKNLLQKLKRKEPTIERAIDLYSKALKEIAAGAQEKGAARGGLTVGTPARSAQDIKNRKYSVQSIFNAAGFQVTMKGGRVIATDGNGQRITEMTEDMVRSSGIGTMIRYAQEVTKSISKAEAQTQVEGLTRLFNLMLKAQDGDMVWRFAGSAMFSAVKSNSDGQYSTTVDFSTVCKKTEEMMRTMSTVMMRTHKGLTKDQIIELQNDILAENGLVPCPVCYVFSRWAGVGGILDNMAKFQKKYDGAEWDDPARMKARIDQLKAATKTKKALQALLMEEDNAYQQFTGELEANQAEQKMLRAEKKSLTGKKADAAANAARVAEIDKRLKELDGLNALLKADIQAIEKSGAPEAAWLERVRSKPNYREEGYVEEDLLYNLLAADRLAEEKPLAWGYRTSRGPSAGKAILPYSDMRVGDWVLGPKANSAKGANPLFSSVGEQFSKDQAKAIDAAKMKVLAQNLIGGQRYQSTSDFMYDYGLDYLLSFFEGQMLGSKMQTYTKVMEFVNLVASVHGDVNISMMPLDAGYVTEADGRQHLIYSSVTGANPEAAIKANHLFDNAQLILVGINDQHILLALEDSEETGGAEIGFVIPYHASGASINNFIRGLVENLKETFDEKNYKNYEPMQNDSHRKNATAAQEARERLRRYLLTGKRGKSELMVMTGNPDGLTDTEMKLLKGRSKDIGDRSFEELREIEKRALAGDKAAIKEYESWSAGFLGDLYKKMWTNEKAKDTYGVRLTGDQPDHIMPHEFWDTRVDREHAYINGFRFRSYCYSLGLTPRFTGVNSAGKHLGYGDFSDSKGYWKTLIDRPMYDRSGKYRDQQTMNVTELSGSISEENAGMLSPEYGREFWGENAQTPDTGVAARAAERYLERHGEKPRFSARTIIEDSEDLIAVHNLTEKNLIDMGKLGGAPAPSIAIVKARAGHDKYGPISLVYTKDTIDPEKNPKNKVYGADAYTPTAAQATTEHEILQDRKFKFEDKIRKLTLKIAGGEFQVSSILSSAGVDEDTDNTPEELAERLASREEVMAAYLADKGTDLPPVMREKQFNRYGNNFLKKVIRGISPDGLTEMRSRLESGEALTSKQYNALLEIWKRDYVDNLSDRMKAKYSDEQLMSRAQRAAEDLWTHQVENFARDALEYYEQGDVEEIDRLATNARLKEIVRHKDVLDWIRPQVEELYGKTGIRNNVSSLTPSGRRRGFNQTHDPYTLENIVKMMYAGNPRGVGASASATGLQSVAADDYKTIRDIKRDSGRLGKEDEEVYQNLKEELNTRIDEMMQKIADATKAGYYELDDAFMNGAQAKTPAALIRSFSKDGIDGLTESLAKELLKLYHDAGQLPTEYFEAKPQRPVGFGEIAAAVVPSDISDEARKVLTDNGVNVIVYTAFDSDDRLEKLNSIPSVRFSARTEEDPQYSAKLTDKERSTEALEDRLLGGRELLGTPALKKLGVKVSGSVGRYANTEQLMAKNKAAKQLKKAAADAERRLQATEAEKDFASGIAAMVYDEEDIPARLRRDVVMELADYYFASDSANLDTLVKLRSDINAGLRAEAGDLLEEADFKPQSMLKLNERTPERNFRAMFGERGDEITEWLVQPVRENEAEKIRWFNAQLDKVREFEDSKGKKRELTRQESALTMKYMEGTAAAQMIADLETDPKNRYGKQTAKNIKNAATNIRNGESAADAAKEFSLGDREKDLAAKYAAWQNTLQELKESDSTIVENAAKAYAELFDQYYEAINDFLVAHGYEPIGYIKGYAPHMQPEATQTMLEKALGALGVNAEVKELPASIAGQTAIYKPNKRWNPYFLQRTGSTAEYDIVKAFESYVDYMADIFYHTDDIMRARQMVRWIRQSFAPEEIRSKLDYIDTIRQAPTEVKTSLLRDAGEIGKTTVMSPMDTEAAMQEYVDKLFEQAKNTSKYSNLVMWLENYANILAGKQSFADRGWEYSTGRKSLNTFNRLNNAFQKSNVAGNLSSVINQTAQLPMIAAELGERDFLGGLVDVVAGKAKNWAQDSDFLTEKEGKDYLYADNADKFIDALYKPASWMDHLVSTVAVRGAFDKAIRQGKSYEQAIRYADDFGRKLMGSRAKGSRPLAYESKGAFSKMIHMFQVECANSWDHVASDLPYEIKQIAKTQGKGKAARTLAALIIRALLGAFLLNRTAEELYGGTPAPFDILGLAANFVASGQGLTTNRWMKKIIDNGMEKLGGERIFGTKATEGSDEFSVTTAGEELIYNVMNDLPLARNVAGVFGLGDQTVPLPGASGEFKDVGTAISKLLKDGVDEGELADLLRATLKVASQFAPGGRQIRKTAEGAEAVIRGGSYKSGKLQYPVKGAADTARALVFGKNATQAARDFWAAGGKALSEKQTGLYQGLVDEGMSQQEAFDTITEHRDEGTLDDYVKWTDSRSRDAGVDEGTYLQFREDTKGITGDPDGKGGTVSGSKKKKIVGYIDGLDDLTPEQKTAMLLDYSSTYSLKDVTWSGGEPAAAAAPEEPAKVSAMRSTLTGIGIQDQKVDALAPVLGGDGSNTSKWRAVADQNLGKEKQDQVLKTIMTEAMYRNWTIAEKADISLDSYVKGREAYKDLDESGTDQNSEWTAALETVTFDSDSGRDNYIKGVLWQIYTGSSSTKNNPFDKTGGQTVLDAKKGGGSGSGSNARLILPTAKKPWEVADDMELRSMNDYGGNVDLTNRRSIPITQANINTVRGWNNMDDARIGDRMTVASQTYKDGDTAIVVTPILPDGTLMTQRDLDRYMDSIIRSGDYANADRRGIILGVFNDGDWNENLKARDEFANRLHELHERKTERRPGLQTREAPRAAKPRGGLVATGRPYTARTGGLVLKKK